MAGLSDIPPPLPRPTVGLSDLVRARSEAQHSETWHSIRQDVHHNNRRCTEGNNIEPWYCDQGTGGKRLCLRCEALWSSR